MDMDVSSNDTTKQVTRGRGKHALTVSAPVISSSGLSGAADHTTGPSMSPVSDAKRLRSGEYSPQWSSPMSPATTQMQQGMASVTFQPVSSLTSSTGPFLRKTSNPSPIHMLPPTHPQNQPQITSSGSSSSISSSASSLSLPASVAAANTSPSHSTVSASSSPSTFSLANHSNATAASNAGTSVTTATSPISLSHHSVNTTSTAAAHVDEADEDEDDDEEAEEEEPVTNGKSKSANGTQSAKKRQANGENRQGASCHQCKTAKSPAHLVFCTVGVNANRKRRCRKKYCNVCLTKTYGVTVTQALKDKGAFDNWQCPSCLGTCTCAGCSRRGATSGGPVPPATPTKAEESSSNGGSATASKKKKQVPSSHTPIASPQSTKSHEPRSSHASPATAKNGSAKKEAVVHPAPPPVTLPASTASMLGMRAVSAPEQHVISGKNGATIVGGGPSAQIIADNSPPPNMDVIASLLLELSTTSQASNSVAPAISSEAPAESVPAQTSITHTSYGSPHHLPTITTVTTSVINHASPSFASKLGPAVAPFTFNTHSPSFSPSSSTAGVTASPPLSYSLGAMPPTPPFRSFGATSLFPESSVGLAKRFVSPTSLVSSTPSSALFNNHRASTGGSILLNGAGLHHPKLSMVLPTTHYLPPSEPMPRAQSEHLPPSLQSRITN